MGTVADVIPQSTTRRADVSVGTDGDADDDAAGEEAVDLLGGGEDYGSDDKDEGGGENDRLPSVSITSAPPRSTLWNAARLPPT